MMDLQVINENGDIKFHSGVTYFSYDLNMIKYWSHWTDYRIRINPWDSILRDGTDIVTRKIVKRNRNKLYARRVVAQRKENKIKVCN